MGVFLSEYVLFCNLFNQSHVNEYLVCSFAFVCFAIVGLVFVHLVHLCYYSWCIPCTFGTFMLLFPQNKFLEVELLFH